MNNKQKYSHEYYRNLLREARIWDGTHNCYFCPDCRRYVPKKKSDDPCIFCGSTNWDLKNPLIHEIINTQPLKKYMYETFRHCIEPFTTFSKQKWEKERFFYKKDATKRYLSENEKYYIRAMELWCASYRCHSGYSLSLCMRWIAGDGDGNCTPCERTYIKYLTFRTPKLYMDYNEEKDDEFFFNLIFDQLLSSHTHNNQIAFKAINENREEYDAFSYIVYCHDDMILWHDNFSVCLYGEQLLQGHIIHLMTALDDFSRLPQYWGSNPLT